MEEMKNIVLGFESIQSINVFLCRYGIKLKLIGWVSSGFHYDLFDVFTL